MKPPPDELFRAGGDRVPAWTTRELLPDDLPVLQAFFEANPEYFKVVNGEPPHKDEAKQEFEDRPPAGMPYEGVFVIGYFNDAGDIIGMASVLSEFLVPHVWHIGLFVVATPLHGQGVAKAMYERLEDWMAEQGAHWIRLGAVTDHPQAWRFWEKMGFVEVRRRHGLQYGRLTHSVIVMVKPLADAGLAQYLSQVVRDQPDS